MDELIVAFLPVGLTGLVLAGLIAAIMSTIDSTLNAASTLVMYDFVKADERGWSAQRIVWIGRTTTFAFIAVAAFWPLVIRDFPGLFNYIQQVFSYAVPPVAAVFLLGVFWSRMTTAGAIASLVANRRHLGRQLSVWIKPAATPACRPPPICPSLFAGWDRGRLRPPGRARPPCPQPST